MSKDYRPRLSIEITPELQRRLQEVLPWGAQRRIICVILEDLLDLIEKHGANLIIYAFAERELTLNKMCRLGLQEEKKE